MFAVTYSIERGNACQGCDYGDETIRSTRCYIMDVMLSVRSVMLGIRILQTV